MMRMLGHIVPRKLLFHVILSEVILFLRLWNGSASETLGGYFLGAILEHPVMGPSWKLRGPPLGLSFGRTRPSWTHLRPPVTTLEPSRDGAIVELLPCPTPLFLSSSFQPPPL
eukprot:2496107-Pyramimonas_sp.AAC.1